MAGPTAHRPSRRAMRPLAALNFFMADMQTEIGPFPGVFPISFAALPIRGLVTGTLIAHRGVWPVQFLNGVGAGMQGVAVPRLVACLSNGTARVNAGQGR